MRRFIQRYPIFSFITLCLFPVHGLLWPLLLADIEPESLRPLKLLFTILPSTAAFMIVWVRGGSEAATELWQRAYSPFHRIRVLIAAICIFLVLGGLSLLGRFYLDGYTAQWYDFPSWTQIALVSPFLFVVPGFAEEFGWRGFLQERLHRTLSIFSCSIVVGIVWGSWHTMDFLLGIWPYNQFLILLFFGYIVGCSIIIGYLYFYSGNNVIVAMTGHFSANAASQFLPLWTDEAGLKTPIFFVALIWTAAFIFALHELISYRRTNVSTAVRERP